MKVRVKEFVKNVNVIYSSHYLLYMSFYMVNFTATDNPFKIDLWGKMLNHFSLKPWQSRFRMRLQWTFMFVQTFVELKKRIHDSQSEFLI